MRLRSGPGEAHCADGLGQTVKLGHQVTVGQGFGFANSAGLVIVLNNTIECMIQGHELLAHPGLLGLCDGTS